MLKITSKNFFFCIKEERPKGKKAKGYFFFFFFLQQSLSNPKTVIFHFANLMNEKKKIERVKPLPLPFSFLSVQHKKIINEFDL